MAGDKAGTSAAGTGAALFEGGVKGGPSHLQDIAGPQRLVG